MSTLLRFSIAGILIGAVGLGVAVFQAPLREALAPPPPAPADSIKDLVGKLASRLADDAPAKPTRAASDPITLTHMGLGFLAILLGALGFVRKEDRRAIALAVALGVLSAAWIYVIVALVIAVVLAVIINAA